MNALAFFKEWLKTYPKFRDVNVSGKIKRVKNPYLEILSDFAREQNASFLSLRQEDGTYFNLIFFSNIKIFNVVVNHKGRICGFKIIKMESFLRLINNSTHCWLYEKNDALMDLNHPKLEA